jgi:hypothetical protein
MVVVGERKSGGEGERGSDRDSEMGRREDGDAVVMDGRAGGGLRCQGCNQADRGGADTDITADNSNYTQLQAITGAREPRITDCGRRGRRSARCGIKIAGWGKAGSIYGKRSVRDVWR